MQSWHVALLLASLCATSTMLGCQGGSPSTPADSGATAQVPMPGMLMRDADQELGVLAVYRVDLDLGTLAATSELLSSREGQGANNNDSLYLLDIANFMRGNTFRVRGITRTATTLDLRYTITHPFAGPSNPRGTPNSTNRSDLGITGMAMFLLDAPANPGNIFFDDGAGSRVVANTWLMTNPDAYYQPAGLMAQTGTANTFPYKVLVDETGPDGSRDGISNGGLATGNFGTDGWTLDELGSAAPFNQWTGYGVLHQGQASTSTASFDLPSVQALGSISLDVAIVAKYNDPRAGTSTQTKRANRLPNENGDATTSQAYRMPHGCSDVPVITNLPPSIAGQFTANEITSATLAFSIQDWDARAAETTNTDLSLDPIVTNVAQGESGLPGFEVCIPGVLSETLADAGVNSQRIISPFTAVIDDDTYWGGDIEVDSGMPGDALVYQFEVTKGVSILQSEGTFTGLAKGVDPEELLGPGQLAVALDGTTLAPLSGNRPHNVTYQSFTVFMDEIIPPQGCNPPELPFAGNPVGAGNFTNDGYQSIPPPGTGTNSAVNLDVAAFPTTAFTPNGGLVMQNYNTASPTFPFDFWLQSMNNSTPFNNSTWIQITNLGTAYTKRSLQIECDPTGRVIFSTVGATYPGGWGGGGHVYGAPAQKYTAGSAGAAPDIYWFDPVTSGPLPTSGSINTISTGGVIPMALTIDFAGNIYGIDQINVLHKWDKVLNYAIDPVDSGFPKDLATIPEIGPPSVRMIQDFVYNDRNKEFLMLWQPDDNVATIVKLQCDLTSVLVSDEGGFGSAGWNRAADIGIDQVDPTGALLPAQGEAQVFTSSSQYTGIKIFRSDTLVEYGAVNFPTHLGPFAHPAFAIALNGTCGGPSSNWTGSTLGYAGPSPAPALGWQ